MVSLSWRLPSGLALTVKPVVDSGLGELHIDSISNSFEIQLERISTWVCLKAGYTPEKFKKCSFNGDDHDKPVDFRVPSSRQTQKFLEIRS